MNKKYLFLLILASVLVGCRSAETGTEYVEYADDVEYQTIMMPDTNSGNATVSEIKYSVPRDGDLTLETRHHVIQIQGDPNTAYEYRVWAGNKDYNDDPDLIVDDGDIMVLQSDNK